MELTPEERRKIYEEEKARIEIREQLEREKNRPSAGGTTSLTPNVAGLLCYLGIWITGIIFIVLEQKNKWVRFHAAQSIVVFGSLLIISGIFGWIPVVGRILTTLTGILGFILWIILMVKAYRGEYYKLPVAGDIAEMIVSSSGTTVNNQKPPEAPPETGEKAAPKPETGAYEPKTSSKDLEKKIEQKVEDFFERQRAGRITGAAFAIAWCIALLIFFNFYHQYFAFYSADTFGGIATWERYPFFTSDISLWLPILTAALIIAIIGNFLLIFFEGYKMRQIIRIIMDGFGLAAVITLLVVFPFDFYVIPEAAAAAGTHIGVMAILVFITIGMSIGLLVRFIKLILNLLKGTDNNKASSTANRT
jgi:uncharacterized membrane protein